MNDLCARLRGTYTIPVNDGAGPLDGRTTFTREFWTPPIQHEAAARIEVLEAALRDMLLCAEVQDFEERHLLCIEKAEKLLET